MLKGMEQRPVSTFGEERGAEQLQGVPVLAHAIQILLLTHLIASNNECHFTIWKRIVER